MYLSLSLYMYIYIYTYIHVYPSLSTYIYTYMCIRVVLDLAVPFLPQSSDIGFETQSVFL